MNDKPRCSDFEDLGEYRRAYVKWWRKNNPERVKVYNREYHRTWRERNREHYRDYQREYQRQWVLDNPDKVKAIYQRRKEKLEND